MKCPRCGRTCAEPGAKFCPSCGVPLASDDAAGVIRQHSELRVHLSPILGEALASAPPGEDFDETLLRVLKARYPEQAAPLLSACTRLIEIEARRANEDRPQTIRRLAQSSPGPEIVLRTTGGESPTTIAQTRVRIGGTEYRSLEEVPPHLRRSIEQAMRGERAAVRPGCGLMLVGGWLLAVWRLLGK